MKYSIVFHKDGYFSGWPANHGIWRWGNEILVGLKYGVFEANPDDHSINREKDGESRIFARSHDGGETWFAENINISEIMDREPEELKERIDFMHPDLAIRINHNRLIVSYDRGNSFSGPFKLPEFGFPLSSRTDYIVINKDECLWFMSHRAGIEHGVEGFLKDRSFCAVTRDGGLSFEFLSNITSPNENIRSVMSSTVMDKNGVLYSSLRRRKEVKNDILGGTDDINFIDIYRSENKGKSWNFLSKACDTGIVHNGNPPAMAVAKDGRFCLVYGDRGEDKGIKARISEDGKHWSEAKMLRRSDTWDIGYPRLVCRDDGLFVAVYYIRREEIFKEQFIEACIFDADEI